MQSPCSWPGGQAHEAVTCEAELPAPPPFTLSETNARWLRERLAEERQAVVLLLEASHDSLLVDVTSVHAGPDWGRVRVPSGTGQATADAVNGKRADSRQDYGSFGSENFTSLPGAMESDRGRDAPKKPVPPPPAATAPPPPESPKKLIRGAAAAAAEEQFVAVVPGFTDSDEVRSKSKESRENGLNTSTSEAEGGGSGRARGPSKQGSDEEDDEDDDSDESEEPAARPKGFPQLRRNMTTKIVESIQKDLLSDEDSEDCRQSSKGRRTLKQRVLDAADLFRGSTTIMTSLTSKREEPPLRAWVRSTQFEVLTSIVVVTNALVLALDLQFVGTGLGFSLEFRGYNFEATRELPWVSEIVQVLDYMFVCLYVLELLIRLYGFRMRLFRSAWTYLDACVIIISVVGWIAPSALDLNPAVARLLRFGKLMRLARVLQTNAYSLKLLAASIEASFHTLFWSLCILVLIQSVAAMFLAQAVQPYLMDVTNPLDRRQEIFGYYGTFWRSLVSMFEITFANWGPLCRMLVDDVHEAFGIFFLVYRCAIGFAVISVIQAVFIQQTMKSAQLDDDFIVQEKNREKAKYVNRLRRLFGMMDSSGDGFISWDEFEPVLKTDQMRALMRSLDMECDDLQLLFQLLDDDGGGLISCQEFVDGVPRMKGAAKSVDVIGLSHTCRRIEAKLEGVTKAMLAMSSLRRSRA